MQNMQTFSDIEREIANYPVGRGLKARILVSGRLPVTTDSIEKLIKLLELNRDDLPETVDDGKDKSDLKKAVEQLHKCSASYIEDLIVLEKFDSDTVWEGTISIFEIKGHPQANKCYAWSSPIDGSTKLLYYAVLHIPPVDSPEKAVRASIVHDFKKDGIN